MQPARATKQSATGDPDERSSTRDESRGVSEELKVDVLLFLKQDINKILREELKRMLSDNFDTLKLELQAVRVKTANNMAAVWTKVEHIPSRHARRVVVV